MQDGKIIEQGLTEEVFRNPQQSLTQKLIQLHLNNKRQFSWAEFKYALRLVSC